MDNLKELLIPLSNFVFKQLTEELIRQGHNLTGDLIKSFDAKIREVGDSIFLDFFMNNYGLSLNYGIQPNKIPYTPPPPYRGGTSKYIEGLIRFAKIKFGADQKRAKQIAFAIAAKHKKFGYPLTGKIGFIDNVLKADFEPIEKIIIDYYEATINLLITEFIENTNK